MSKKIFPAILAIALVAALFWGRQESVAHAQVSNMMESQYQSAFYDLVACMENLSVLTSKVQVTSSPVTAVKLLSDIRWQASFAQDNLSDLPLEHATLTKSAKFLNQLADYASVMAGKLTSGQTLTDEEKNKLKELGNQVSDVSGDIQALQNRISEDNLKLFNLKNSNEAAKEITEDADPVGYSFEQINERATEYPAMIYDGPFSDHMEDREPQGLSGEEVSVDAALAKAKEFTAILRSDASYSFEKLDGEESLDKAKIPVYNFTATNDSNKKAQEETIYINMTKTGGRLVMLMNNRHLSQGNLTEEEAMSKAEAFLKQAGFDAMSPTYTTNQDNALTIAYVYMENGVIIYPDQVKVKVALDNGQIVGFEAASYFMSHRTRNLEAPAIDASTARQAVTAIEPEEEGRLALIPTDFGTEVLCYEFQGKAEEQNYLVYINAETGQEQDLLQIIDTPGGKFTM